MVDKDGDCHKRVPLVPEAVEILERAEEDFWRIFNRAPSKGSDPVFLWKYLVSEEELERQAVDAMQRAEVRPHIIHAYRKTGGLLISRENEKLATTKDLADWNAAIDQYFELERNPPPEHPIDALLRSFEMELDHCIICFGYVLEHGLKRNAKRIRSSSAHFSWTTTR
ncbi:MULTISPECIES: hypothetical protein [unclassified Methylibium]|uniref:hypothetical protein n=1 Tax=unclassified Methylibium TaxID=2633235 RepID=UPI001267989E|nr:MULTISPECIES: hypothetical protein [unclassified Methylibium]